MLFQSKVLNRLDRLEQMLQNARALTPRLMRAVIAETFAASAVGGSIAEARMKPMIEAQAWTDAALMLMELATPAWTIRRIACDDGAWHCSLSRHPQLPEWLDQPTVASHALLPLAIMCAVVEALRYSSNNPRLHFASEAGAPERETIRTGTIVEHKVTADNFA